MGSPGPADAIDPGARCGAHPEAAAVLVCGRCGTFVCGACAIRIDERTGFCFACADRVGRTPWEDRKQVGWLRGLASTVWRCLFDAEALFRRGPRTPTSAAGVGFAMLSTSAINLGASVTAYLLFVLPQFASMEPSQAETFGGLLGTFTVYCPFAGLGAFFGQALALHLALLMTGTARARFDATIRVSAYSAAASLLAVVPLVGPGLALGWTIVYWIPALASAHGAPRGRVTLAVVLASPFALLATVFFAPVPWLLVFFFVARSY